MDDETKENLRKMAWHMCEAILAADDPEWTEYWMNLVGNFAKLHEAHCKHQIAAGRHRLN